MGDAARELMSYEQRLLWITAIVALLLIVSFVGLAFYVSETIAY